MISTSISEWIYSLLWTGPNTFLLCPSLSFLFAPYPVLRIWSTEGMAHNAMDQTTTLYESLYENFEYLDAHAWPYGYMFLTSQQSESSQAPQFDASPSGIEGLEQLEHPPEGKFEMNSENNSTLHQTSPNLIESIQHGFGRTVTPNGPTDTAASREFSLYPVQSIKHEEARKRRKRKTLAPNIPSPTPNSEGTYRCSHPGCNAAEFDTEGHLKKHMNQHTRPYLCTICRLNFARNYDLQRHRRSVHGEGEPLYCSEAGCSRSRTGTGGPFKRKDKRDEHYKNFHDKRALSTAEGNSLNAISRSSNTLNDVPTTLMPQTSTTAPYVPMEIQDTQANLSFGQNNLKLSTNEQRIALLEQENAELRNEIQNLKKNISKQLLDHQEERRVLIRLLQQGLDFRA